MTTNWCWRCRLTPPIPPATVAPPPAVPIPHATKEATNGESTAKPATCGAVADQQVRMGMRCCLLVDGGGGYPPAGYRGICETMGLSPIPSISYDVSRTCLREISETSSSLSHQILVRHMMIHFIYIIIKELSECLTKTLKPGRGISPPPKPTTRGRPT